MMHSRKKLIIAVHFIFIVSVTILQAAPGHFDWSTGQWNGVFQWGGLVFYNNRWNHVNGSMFLDTSTTGEFGKNVHFWTEHSEKDQCCSSPWASTGGSGVNGINALNDIFPIQLKKIEELRAYWKFRVPMPLNPGWGGQDRNFHQYHVYYQLYVGPNPDLNFGNWRAGDGAFAMFDSFFYRQNGYFGEDVEIGGVVYDTKDAMPTHTQFKSIFVAVRHDLTPDENGIIEVRNLNLKALVDRALEKGWWKPDHYLVVVSNCYEVMNLPNKSIIETLDLSYKVKEAGKAEQYLPPWKGALWNDPNFNTVSVSSSSQKNLATATTKPVSLHIQMRQGQAVLMKKNAHDIQYFSVLGKKIDIPSRKY